MSFGTCVLPCLPARLSSPSLERLDERLVLEFVRQVEPALVARVGVEIGKDFVHAAELGVEHPLDLLVVERRQNLLGPLGELDFQLPERSCCPVKR